MTITDTEDPELDIRPTAITVNEGDEVGETFSVSLSERPQADVTVDVSGVSGSDLTLVPTSLTFTTDNWNDPQDVNVTAKDNDDVGDDVETLTLSASGGGYNGVRGNVRVTIKDNETVSLVIDPTSLEIPEEESSAFTVHLSNPPSSRVSVTITPRDGAKLSVDRETLTFTAGDSGTPQTVTVTANHDDDAFNDHEKWT